MKKALALGLVLGVFTVAGSAAAQYPYGPPPPPAPGSPPPPAYGAPPPPAYGAPPQPAYGYAPPRPVQTFGGPGTLAISSDMNLGFYGQSVSNNGGSSWTFLLAPAADYFVIQGLSIGAQISYEHDHTSGGGSTNGSSGSSSSTDTDTFGIGPRIGYNIPITDLFSFWPKVALIFTDTAGKGYSANTFDVQVYAPVLLHLAPHFFMGLGPQIQTDLTASESAAGQSINNPPKTTSYGLYFTIGGWTVPF